MTGDAPQVRHTIWLVVCFAVIAAIGVVTVLVPELRDADPQAETHKPD